jgi:hypothetical protein
MHDTARCLGYPSDSSRAAREWAQETSCGRHRCGPVRPGWVRRCALHLRSLPVRLTYWPVLLHSLPVRRASLFWSASALPTPGRLTVGVTVAGWSGPAGPGAAPSTSTPGLCGLQSGLSCFTLCPYGVPLSSGRRRALPTSHWPWAVCRAARRRAGSPARITTVVFAGVQWGALGLARLRVDRRQRRTA